MENKDKFSINKDSDKAQEEKGFDLQSTMTDRFLNCQKCYDYAKPLLDSKFTNKLDEFFKEGTDRFWQIYLYQTHHEEVKKIRDVYENKSVDFVEENFWEVLEKKLLEKNFFEMQHRPIQNIKDLNIFLNDIASQHNALREEFSVFAANSSCLEEYITQQLKELVK